MERERKRLDYSKDIGRSMSDSILLLDNNLIIITANQFFYETFQITPEEIEKKHIYDVKKIDWNNIGLRAMLEKVLIHNSPFEEFDFK